ncbi:MAG: cyclic lactone autoinducer peptide [Ruminococcus sp.]|nr:cyclic lactone autoinducer peptide [Ruminococcus sp.]
MKKRFYTLITKFGGMFAALALVITSFNANSACVWLAYQPEEPEEVKALKKK